MEWEAIPREVRCQVVFETLSKLDRNVPFLTSIEMSPFFCLVLGLFFLFLSGNGFSLRISRQDALGATISISPDLQHPLFRWLGPERSPQGEAQGQANDGRGAVAAYL